MATTYPTAYQGFPPDLEDANIQKLQDTVQEIEKKLGTGSTLQVSVANVLFSGARVTNAGAQSIGTGSWTLLTFDTEAYDTSSYHDTSSNKGRLTAPVTGYYLVLGHADLDSHATGQRSLYIAKNGSTVYSYGDNNTANTAGANGITAHAIVPLTAGDYVQLYIFQDSLVSLNAVGGVDGTSFSISLLGV